MPYAGDVVTIAVLWLLSAMPSTVFVACRFIVRYRYPESFNYISDILLFVSWLFVLLNAGIATSLVALGLIRSTTSISQMNVATTYKVLKVGYFGAIQYYTGLYFIKASIIAVFYSLIPRTSITHRLWLHILSGFVFCSFVVVFCLNSFTCMPIERNWAMDASNCYGYSKPYVLGTSAALQLATDLGILIVPFPLLRGLMVSRRAKFGLALVFSLGGLSILATVLRLAFVLGSASNVTQTTCWSSIELMTGICVACFPAFRALYIRRRRQGGTSKGYYSSEQSLSSTGASRSRGLKAGISGFGSKKLFQKGGTCGTELTEFDTEEGNGAKSQIQTSCISARAPTGRKESSAGSGGADNGGWRSVNESEEKIMVPGEDDLIVTTNISYEISDAKIQ